MKRFTRICKGNKIRQFDYVDGIMVDDEIIVMDSDGKIIVDIGNPITWPDSATNGMKAIVDVKAGTLRFGYYDGWPRAHTEFVVSEYVEDSAPVHVLDLIKEWPTDGTRPAVLVSPPGFSWRHHDGGVWSLCGMNGGNEFFEGHWLNYHENKNKYSTIYGNYVPSQPEISIDRVMKMVDVWPVHLERSGEKITEDWVWGGINGVTVIVNQSTGQTITENDWRAYLVDVLRKNPPVETVTSASMLTAALGHMEDRAKTYDAPGGERSMGKTVAAFNVITGHNLTEEDGWLFMEILKQVRSQQGDYRADNYEDLVAYAALRGECAARERGNK